MPDAYELQLERKARQALGHLPDAAIERLRQAIEGLATEPRPRGCEKLVGAAPAWRIRVGEYRIIYAVFDRERIVKIIDIARRTTQTYHRRR